VREGSLSDQPVGDKIDEYQECEEAYELKLFSNEVKMISRREFVRLAGITTLSTIVLPESVANGEATDRRSNVGKANKPLMYPGTQKSSTKRMLQFYKRCGVNNICGNPDPWSLEGLMQLKDRCLTNGITLDMVPIGMPRSVGLLGDKDYRDRQIEQTCDQIRMTARAGIPAIKYNMTVLNVLRTGTTAGRGGSRYSNWTYEKADRNKSPARAGEFPDELFWERISYFLDSVVPVATEYKVRMACHPHDPGVPTTGYHGVQRVLGTVEGLKKFINISPSSYHGLNFCVGTVACNLDNPSHEIFDVIRYFGRHKRIFNVHFRNIRGRRNNFQEVYPDEGEIDMYRVMNVLKEVGYSGMVMPDHVPMHSDDPDQFQGLAFALGYIKALIQAVYSDS
jgi:mannonate dehydratase